MNNPDNMTLQATVEKDGSNASRIDSQTWSDRFAWLARILILITLVAAPWMLGSVQFWSQLWIASALLIALALWWFETALNKRNAQVIPYIVVFLVIGILIGLFQILPLTGFLGDFFLGRQTELYQEFSQPNISSDSNGLLLRISLNTNGTFRHIRLLIISVAALLLSCRYFRTPRDLTILFGVMSANGVALSIFGIIQKLTSDGQQLFWSIPLLLGGTPFGPYVNRNNSAGFLLICLGCAVGLMHLVMSSQKNRGPIPIISKEIPIWRQLSQQLLYFISELTAVKLSSLLAVAFISLGIVASLSRGAVLALLVATIMTIVSYGIVKKPKNMSVVLAPLAIMVVLLTVWMGFSDDLVSRFDKTDTTQEIKHWNARIQTWTDSWPSVAEMGKLGSGLGTYDTISRLYRTDKETRVFSFAENQYFQALIEAGWPGLFIFLMAWALAFYYSYFLLWFGQSPATVSVGIAGIFLLWSQAAASFLDFGLYIPANALAMSCMVGTIGYYAHSMAHRLKKKSWLRFQFPNSFVYVVLVASVAACTMTMLDLNRKSRIEGLKTPGQLSLESLNYDEVDQKIGALRNLVENTQALEAMNELGRLRIHRTRLELFDYYNHRDNLGEADSKQTGRIWDETSLIRIHERAEALELQSKLSRQRFVGLESIQVNLPFAKHWFEESIRLSPLQPEVQVVLGEITSVLFDIQSGSSYLERAIKIAPSNAMLLRQVAVLYIQAGQFEMAAPHLKRYLDLEPSEFKLMLQVTTYQMSEFMGEVDNELILNSMLPDNPKLLFEFAQTFAIKGSLVQKKTLERAEDLLQTVSQSDHYVTLLKGRIKLAMGDYQSAVELLRKALVNNPNDQEVRLELVDALVTQERYEAALEEANELIHRNERNPRYRRLFDSIKSKMKDLLEN